MGQVQSMVDPQSTRYPFRACTYEKMDPKWSTAQKSHIQNHVLPCTETSQTDFHKWDLATKDNPKPNDLYVKQVSSVKELTERAKHTLNAIKNAKKMVT